MLTVQNVTTQASDGEGSSVDLEDARSCVLALDCFALTGTLPTLTVSLETSDDETNWRPAGSFETASARGRFQRAFVDLGQFVKAVWDLGGTTPQFTFAVTGQPANVYANLADLQALGIHSEALERFTDGDKCSALEQASRVVDDYLSGQFVLPLLAWANASLKRAVTIIAAYDLLSGNGFNPDNPDDKAFLARYKDLTRWLEGVAEGTNAVSGITDSSTESGSSDGFEIDSDDLRGWLVVPLKGSFAPLEGLKKAVERLSIRGRSQVSLALKKDAERLIDNCFETSTSPEGEAWAPTKAGNKPLIQTQDLRKAVRVEVSGKGYSVRVNIAYAGFHQDGTDKIPARPFLPTGNALPGPWLTSQQHVAEQAILKVFGIG